MDEIRQLIADMQTQSTANEVAHAEFKEKQLSRNTQIDSALAGMAALVDTRFKDLDQKIGIGLGVVDIKVNHVETADQIASSIDAAEQVLGEGRVKYIHPDCGFWMLKRSIADRKIAALAMGRDLFLGS